MTVRINKSAFNIREKLSELERPIGLKGSELMKAETAQEARDFVSAGRKNLIINGDFKVSQRGSYTSSTSMVNNTYYLDRWLADHGSTVTATFTHITTDLPKQYRNETNNGLKFEATSSNSSAYLGFRQKYEFMSHLDGKFVTVSAWVKSNKQAVIINYDGSGAPYDYAQHSGSGQWEYLSYTTFITSTTHNYFDIFIINPITYAYTPISSGDYVEVTNYQLEIGKNATEFEHRSYGEELALCQRYFEVVFSSTGYINTCLIGKASSISQAVFAFPWKVEKRATPTTAITGTGILYYNGTTSTSSYSYGNLNNGTTGGRFTLNSVSGSPLTVGQAVHLDVNSSPPFRLTVSAEL